MNRNILEQSYKSLEKNLIISQNEEEVRLSWVRALESVLPITFSAERGRKDLSYNNVVIEFKGPHKFNGMKSSTSFKEAINDRLLPYIVKTSIQENIDQSDYIGIAIDNEYICFAFVENDEINAHELLPISLITFEMVVESCRNNFRRSITSCNLIEDFGHSSSQGQRLMQALAEALEPAISSRESSKIKMLYEEWKTLYGQVADISKDQQSDIKKIVKVTFDSDLVDTLPQLLFVIHTYNSLIIKLLAAEIIASRGLASGSQFSQELIIQDDSNLLHLLILYIEKSNFFETNGIQGFVEEAIFSWYTDTEDLILKEILDSIREILVKISLYRTDKTDHTRDVLRDFYQNLVPDTLRKSLGEFYTPDWLVDLSVNKLNVKEYKGTRFLDPTCGSGSFLLEIIRRKKSFGIKKGCSPLEIFDDIVNTVWGFDLNPLAVQTARTNFLIAISDLLKQIPGTQFEIPILLADAIYSPARMPGENEEYVEYRIGSQVSNLKVILPCDLAFNRILLDQVFEIMGDCVEENLEFLECKKTLISNKILTEQNIEKWNDQLNFTYDQVLSLHRRNWNGIWFRIVRNFFWSATAGHFDYVIGNPPWVRWSKLPEAYRERAKPTCEQYKIFSSTPHHGGNELDISGMITYTTSDKWLKEGGELIFLLTQTHFQSPSSEGFRKFKINDEYNLLPIEIEDLKELKPFPDAANKTSIAHFKKNKSQIKYPIDYYCWKAKKGQKKAINPKEKLSDVLKHIDRIQKEATPVQGVGSPLAIMYPGRFSDVSKITGISEYYQGRKGITADLNGLYFVEILETNETSKLVQIETRPQAGRKDIGSARKYWVEPDLLYPLIKGASDFKACYFSPKNSLYVIVPNKGIVKSEYEKADLYLNQRNPKLKNYFKNYSKILSSRSTYSTRMKNAPFYCIYNVGDYTFAKYKVIWAEQSGQFAAAVAKSQNVPLIGERAYVPDHKIFFIDFEESNPAFFLCGLLNCQLVKEYVESHNISIQVGNIFKHMSLPKYNNENENHIDLVGLVKKAHSIESEIEREKIINKISTIAEKIILE